MQDSVVIPSDRIRVLGITKDDTLKFDLHMSDTCKKISQQINALKRISKFLTQDSRKSIYRSFIAAKFEKLRKHALRLVFFLSFQVRPWI